MRAVLIHGIHTEDPPSPVISPVRNLIPILKTGGFEVIYPEYGWIAGLETKILNPAIVGCILAFLKTGDTLIGHSNGCAVIYDIMNHTDASGKPDCPQLAGVSFINGALEQNIVLPPCAPWIDVYFNAGDEITEAAKVAARLGLVDPVWGELGHAGYNGTNPKIPNIDCGATPGEPMVWGHSDWFTPGKVEPWGQFLVERQSMAR